MKDLILKIFDKLTELFHWVEIIYEWEEGGLFVFGRWKKKLGPGLRFKIPYIMSIVTTTVVDDTVLITNQQVFTKEKTSLCLTISCLYCIKNIEHYLLRMTDREKVLKDRLMAAISDTLNQTNEIDIHKNRSKVNLAIKQKAMQLLGWYGYEIKSVVIGDICEAIPVNLLGLDGGRVISDE